MADSRFRHLIYSMNLKWLPLTRVSLSSAFSPAVAMREGERARERILPWVLRELPLVLKCVSFLYSSGLNESRLFEVIYNKTDYCTNY